MDPLDDPRLHHPVVALDRQHQNVIEAADLGLGHGQTGLAGHLHAEGLVGHRRGPDG